MKTWSLTTGSLCARMSRGFNGQDAQGLLVVGIIQGGGVAATLDASYYKGPGARNGKEREFMAIEAESVVYPGMGITAPVNRSNPKPGDAAPCLTNDSRNYLANSGRPQRKYIVRRLTPVECQRLQGFPDGYEDGVGGSDSTRYKMWGNGMALPNMYHLMSRLAAMDRGEEI